MDLQVKTEIKISNPAYGVFEAILGLLKMSNCFIAPGSGRLEEGKILTWIWADYNNAELPIKVQRL